MRVLRSPAIVVLLLETALVTACASERGVEPAPSARPPVAAAASAPGPSVAAGPAVPTAPAPSATTPATVAAAPTPAPADGPALSADDQRADARSANVFTAKLYARLKRTPGN